MKIETLTQEQLDRIPIIRDKWLKIGLSTGITDRILVERKIDAVYRAGKLEPPGIKIWLDSSYAGCIGVYLLSQVWDQVRNQAGNQVWNQVWDQVRNQVGNQAGNQVWNQVGNQVRNQVWDQVGNQVWNPVWDQVRNQVGNQVWNPVWDQVRNQVWDQVRNQVGNQVWNQVWDQVYSCGWGIHDSGWLSFYDYFSKYLDMSSIQSLIDFSQHIGWWWPFENAIILTPKPISLTRDDNHRLHHDSKKAVEYPDGWGFCCWHGTRVPEEWILQKDKLDLNLALTWENIEQRRCLCEIIGWDKVGEKVGAKEVHRDEYGVLKELPASPATNNESARFVEVINSTDQRKFWIPVPREMERAKQAVAWTYSMEEKDYCPIVRT